MTEPQTAEHTHAGRRKLEGGLCPQCGKLRVHRSHRRGIAERIIAVVGHGGIRRCHACDLRFTRIAGSIVYVDEARRMLLRASLVTAGTAAAVALLVRIL